MTTPRLTPGSRLCQCGACHEFFASPTTFDRHRTGPDDTRGCLTPTEMRARGMALNARGYWVGAVPAPRMARAT